VEEVPEQAIPLDLVDSASAIPTPAKLVLVALTLAIRTGR
jgi:hypothetical protein